MYVIPPEPEPPPSKHITHKIINTIAEELAYTTDIVTMETNNNKCEEITQARDPSTAPVCQNRPTSSTVHKIHSQPEHNRLTMMHLIKSAQTTPIPLPSPLKLHIDGGANWSITNDLTLLLWQKKYKTILHVKC